MIKYSVQISHIIIIDDFENSYSNRFLPDLLMSFTSGPRCMYISKYFTTTQISRMTTWGSLNMIPLTHRQHRLQPSQRYRLIRTELIKKDKHTYYIHTSSLALSSIRQCSGVGEIVWVCVCLFKAVDFPCDWKRMEK